MAEELGAVEVVEDEIQLGLEDLKSVTEAAVRYVLCLGDEHSLDGAAEAYTVVVLKREGGLLLALPDGFVSEELLLAGSLGEEEAVFGLSKVVTIPGVIMEDSQLVPIGVDLPVLLVDCKEEVVHSMRRLEIGEDFVIPFSAEDPEAFPRPAGVVASALAWLREVAESPFAGRYLSTPEVTAESGEGLPLGMRPRPKPKASHQGARQEAPTGSERPKPRPKKPTTASLATTLESMSEALQNILQRQDELEKKVNENPVTSAMQQPLGQQLQSPGVEISTLAKSMQPPPRTAAAKSSFLGNTSLAPKNLQELEKDKQLPEEQMGLAQVLNVQTEALTTLVAHLAAQGQDAMGDLMSGTATPGSRGAAGRAKLQADLAAQQGLFFDSVMRSMSRRMSPTTPSTMTFQQMMGAGICGTKYLERFGGYGKGRDLGVIQYQVMKAMDFLQTDNLEATRDTVALLAVMLEQAALDGGRLDLGQILTLSDDPPSAIFSHRQIQQISRARAFAPLADQKWITTSLAFIKELDTISQKRLELMSSSQSSIVGGGAELGSGKGKGDAKGRGRGKKKQQTSTEEEV